MLVCMKLYGQHQKCWAQCDSFSTAECISINPNRKRTGAKLGVQSTRKRWTEADSSRSSVKFIRKRRFSFLGFSQVVGSTRVALERPPHYSYSLSNQLTSSIGYLARINTNSSRLAWNCFWSDRWPVALFQCTSRHHLLDCFRSNRHHQTRGSTLLIVYLEAAIILAAYLNLLKQTCVESNT